MLRGLLRGMHRMGQDGGCGQWDLPSGSSAFAPGKDTSFSQLYTWHLSHTGAMATLKAASGVLDPAFWIFPLSFVSLFCFWFVFGPHPVVFRTHLLLALYSGIIPGKVLRNIWDAGD